MQRSIPILPAAITCPFMLALILFISLMPRPYAPLLLIPGMLLIVTIFAARLPILALLKRLLLLEPFVLGVAFLALFSPVSDPIDLFLFLVIRCTLALLTMLIFTALTPFTDLLRFLRLLHIPLLLVTTLALMHRYLFVLADESANMRRARLSRTFTPQRRLAWSNASIIIAQLFLRASRRADRIYDAMCARGWGSNGREGGH